jgi:streptogramin lyase
MPWNDLPPAGPLPRPASLRRARRPRPDRGRATRRLVLEALEDRLCLDSSTGFTAFPIPTPNGEPRGVALGPDDAIWFTESYPGKIGRLDLSTHQITEYASPRGRVGATSIALGPDDALWFTESDGIGRIDPWSHQLTEYPMPTVAG